MNRRNFVRAGLAGGAALASVRVIASEPVEPTASASAPEFELDEATISDLRSAMSSGKHSSSSLTRKYLERIEEIDKHGPAIRSVIEINPDALAIAAERDKDRKALRLRGPLHG